MPTRRSVRVDLATALGPDLGEDHPTRARADPEKSDRRPPTDRLRRTAHISLILLLSPALLAVLAVGGVAVLIEVVSRVGLRVFPGPVLRRLAPRRAPGEIAEASGQPSVGRGMRRGRGRAMSIGRPAIMAGEGGERSSLLPRLPIQPMLFRTRKARTSRDASTS
jgi:hypothetical protein